MIISTRTTMIDCCHVIVVHENSVSMLQVEKVHPNGILWHTQHNYIYKGHVLAGLYHLWSRSQYSSSEYEELY